MNGADPGGDVGSGPRVALALGGGSARGLAHIAMLEAFDELGVQPAFIAGTSMGAICGAAYAAGLPARDVRLEFTTLLANRMRFFKDLAVKLRGNLSSLWSLRHPGVVDNVTLFEMLMPEVMRRDFDTLRIPFAAIAADFYANEQVVLDRGPLIPALAASASLPNLARPVVIDGRVLIDGGYVNPLPFDVAMQHGDVVVAVDVTGSNHPKPGATMPTAFELANGATQLLFHAVTREKLKHMQPDILIRPDVGSFTSMDYFKMSDILARAQPAKDELKRQLAQKLAALA
ncbi:MAG TPA: patatin-like phospholipase family protein [Hyphomicrobiaceae bacterium]|jgi:NTE family protein|nr:patatin-like phospholipase family protein [Hyphomicrobiaceae bacterium]